MDTPDIIRERFSKEALRYREEAPLVNFDAEPLFRQLISVTSKIFPDFNSKIKVLDIGAGNGLLTEIIIKNILMHLLPC